MTLKKVIMLCIVIISLIWNTCVMGGKGQSKIKQPIVAPPEYWLNKWQNALEEKTKEPLYAIAVTRKVIGNASEGPLSDEDIYLVMYALSKILGTENKFVAENPTDSIVDSIASYETVYKNYNAQYQYLYRKLLDSSEFEDGVVYDLLCNPRFQMVQNIQNPKELLKQHITTIKQLVEICANEMFEDPNSFLKREEAILEAVLKNGGIDVKNTNIFLLKNDGLIQNLNQIIFTLSNKLRDIITLCNNDNVFIANKQIQKKGRLDFIWGLKEKIRSYHQYKFGRSNYHFLNDLNSWLSKKRSWGIITEHRKKVFAKSFRDIDIDFETNFNTPSIMTILNLDLSENCVLIAFNEMFFSKSVPLTWKQQKLISDYAKVVSKLNPQILLNANFLYEIREALNLNIETYKEKTLLLTSSLSWGKRFFYTGGFKDLLNKAPEEYFNFALQKQRARQKQMQWQKQISGLLANTSFMYWNGEIISNYKKYTYREEDNIGTQNGSLYAFGTGKDYSYAGFFQVSPYQQMADLVNKTITIEICYDLEIGIRKNLNNYPSRQLIHLVESNVLPIDKKVDNNLPKAPFILHVDPQYVELLNNFKQQKPIDVFSFIADNNQFIFTVWKLK